MKKKNHLRFMLNEVKRSGLFEYIEVITEVKLLTIGGKLNKAL